MNKQELVEQVRNLFNITNTLNSWFTKEEMLEIVSQLKGNDFEWTDNNSFFEEELYGLGWEPQKTTDSHPTTDNLEFLLKANKIETLPTNPFVPDSAVSTNSSIESFFTSVGINFHELQQINIQRNPTVVTLTFSE